ncbi:hypothetical protein [Ralstonia sp.]|uniref:hypothetical protein n=1 Tax=Ralstonia sp. TaxID=54061 RepID=UPI0031E1B31B
MKDVPADSTAQIATAPQERPTRKWPTSLDPLKLVAGAVAFLGIQAWMAGEVFMMGYWNAAHYSRGIASLSVQSTALLGFCGAYRCWIWAAAAIAAYGVLWFLTSLRRKRSEPPKPGRVGLLLIGVRDWFAARFELDGSSAAPGVILLSSALFYYGVLISPAALWILGANYEGEQLFKTQACQARGGALPTRITLTDGSILWGNVIERSDKLIALLTKDAVVMVADGEKGGRVVENTSLSTTKCPTN